MDFLWLLEYMNRQRANASGTGKDTGAGAGALSNIAPGEHDWQKLFERPSDLGIAFQIAQGDLSGATQTWAMRQTAPWLEKQLTDAFSKMGLGNLAGPLAGFLTPLALSSVGSVVRRWLTPPSKAKPSDTNYMMNLQASQTLQGRAEQALNEAVDIGARRAQGILNTAQALAGSNQYLGATLKQASAPAAAEAATQIVTQGLQNKTALLQAALQQAWARQNLAQQFAQQLQLQRIQDEQARRNAMMQMILAMAMRNQQA